MKGFLKTKLLLTLAAFVMVTAAIVATLSGPATRSHAESTQVSAQSGATHSKITKQPCDHLQVHLQGNKPPITRCLDNTVSPRNGSQPGISITCDGFSLVLYWDANLSGGTICFSGYGWANLTDYCAPINYGGCLQNWNDKVSSFNSQDTPGTFYKDINLQNYMFDFAVFTQANLNGSYNDAISSLAVQSCNPNDNPGETADHYISRCLRGSVRREFPTELLGWTIQEIFACAARGQSNCIKAKKLLTDSRFKK